jgi:tetratricopeptide (TPR) repeat protein
VVVIKGSKTRIVEVSSGRFYCPNCNASRPYRRKRAVRYATLYFIPIFQLENLGEFVECQVCLRQWRPELLNREPPSPEVRLLIAVRRDYETGTPTHVLLSGLKDTGFDDEAAQKLLELSVSGSPEPHLQRAEQLARQGDFQAAEETLEEALRTDSSWGPSIAGYPRESTQQQSKPVSGYALLVHLAAKSNRKDLALRYFERMLDLNPLEPGHARQAARKARIQKEAKRIAKARGISWTWWEY